MKSIIKKAITVSLVSACIIAGAYYTFTDVSSIDISTSEGKQTVAQRLSGTWLHTDTLCKGMAHYESIKEFTFGANLPSTTIGAIRLDRYQVDFTELDDPTVAKAINEWFDSCDAFDRGTGSPIVIQYDNYSRARTFYYYPNISLILLLEDKGIMSLVKQSEVFKLPVYQND